MPTISPTDMARSLYPHQVEYRLAVGQGVRVVLVHLNGVEPRISAYSERFGQLGKETCPMSLGLREIEQFVVDARQALGV